MSGARRSPGQGQAAMADGPAAAWDAGAGVLEISATTAVPALAMLLGSAAVSMTEPSEALQARLQRFSAGLLVGAVVSEIFPILKRRLVLAGSEARGLEAVSWSNL